MSSLTFIFLTVRTHLSQPKNCFIAVLAGYFALLMHYYQPNYGGSGLDNPINPLGWIVISVLVAIGIVQIARQQLVVYSPYLLIISAACLSLLLPLIYSHDAGWYSHARLAGLFAGLFLLYSIMQMNFTKVDFHNILLLILIATLIESFMALIQFYILPYQSLINVTHNRPSSIFFQANVAATFFGTGLAISLYLSQQFERLQTSKFLKLLLSVAPVTITIAIVLLQSRTGFLGALIGVGILLMIKNKINKRWLVLASVGLFIALASLTLLDRYTRSIDVYSHPGPRSQIYQNSFDAFLEKPLLGHGYGSFARVYSDVQAEKFIEDNTYKPLYMLSHPHNEPLLWMVEGGMLPFSGLLVIMLCSAFMFVQQKAVAKFALIFPISLHTLTEFPFYHSVASLLIFIILLSFATDSGKKHYRFDAPRKVVFYGFAIIVVSLSSVQMLSLLISHKILTETLVTRQTDALMTASLPLVSDNYELILNELRFITAIDNENRDDVEQYIIWARQQLHAYPKERHFHNLVLAYLYLDDIVQAKKMLAQARLLFPTLSWQREEDAIASKLNSRPTTEAKSLEVRKPLEADVSRDDHLAGPLYS